MALRFKASFLKEPWPPAMTAPCADEPLLASPAPHVEALGASPAQVAWKMLGAENDLVNGFINECCMVYMVLLMSVVWFIWFY